MSWHWILEMEKILWVFISVTIFEIQWQILKCFHKVISSNLKTSYFWRVEIELDLIELCFCKSHFQTNVFLILKGILYLWNWYNCRQFIICALDSRVLYDRILKVKFFFEITAFLNYEWGTSRARNSKSYKNNTY